MVVFVARVGEPPARLQVNIQQRQRVVGRNRPLNAARFSKNKPRRGPRARKLWDIRGCDVKGGWRIMPVLCCQIDENLQRVGACAGAGLFVVKRAARGLEPIQITGRQIEIIAKGIAVVKRAFTVLCLLYTSDAADDPTLV